MFTRNLAMGRVKMRSVSNGVDVRLPILSLIVHNVLKWQNIHIIGLVMYKNFGL